MISECKFLSQASGRRNLLVLTKYRSTKSNPNAPSIMGRISSALGLGNILLYSGQKTNTVGCFWDIIEEEQVDPKVIPVEEANHPTTMITKVA